MTDGTPERFRYPTAFTVYDGRQHVLGASMLSDIDAHLRASWPDGAKTPCAVKRAKFLHKTGCDGEITVQRGGGIRDLPKDAACSVTGQYGSGPFLAWFVPDTGAPVTRNVQSGHMIEAVDPAGDFAGRCRIANDRLDKFLLQIVDANKHVQLASAPLRDRKWVSELVSIENFAMCPALCPVDSVLEIENLANRTAADRIFTLNRLRFADREGAPVTLDMGFSFFPEQSS